MNELILLKSIQPYLQTDFFMKFSIFFNNEFITGLFCLLVIVSIILIDAYHKKRLKQYVLTEIIFTVDVYLTSFFVTYLLKYLVNRPRPFMLEYTLTDPTISSSLMPYGSFPSYHSVVAVILVVLVWRHHKIWGILLSVFGVLIMLSRLALGVHYPSDVIAGALLGIVIVYILNTHYDRIRDTASKIIKK